MRREQKIHLQLVSPSLRRKKPGFHQHAGTMWIRNNFFFQPVAPFRIHAGHTIAERLGFNAFYLARQIAFFFMKKRSAVTDEELSVTDLGPVNGGVIDFSYDALCQGEPDPARYSISCADAVFGTVRPGGRNTGLPRSAALGY